LDIRNAYVEVLRIFFLCVGVVWLVEKYFVDGKGKYIQIKGYNKKIYYLCAVLLLR
jgi:hypothetical protein